MPRVTVEDVPSRPDRYDCPVCGGTVDVLLVGLGNWAQVWCPECKKERIAKPRPGQAAREGGSSGDQRARPPGVARTTPVDRPVAGQTGFLPGTEQGAASSDTGRTDSQTAGGQEIGR